MAPLPLAFAGSAPCPPARRARWLGPLMLAVLACANPARAFAADCAAEAAALTRDAAQLPKEELANPTDHENTCITLEVNMDFAARMAAYTRTCPADPPAGTEADRAADWVARGARDALAFKQHRCRRSY